MRILKTDGTPNKSYKHGGKVNGKATHLYSVWRCMKSRCFYKKDRCYYLYGARGVSVYPLWVKNFSAFREYVESLPNYNEDNRQLDRINNNGNYEPGNIRWATFKENASNKRNNVHITYKGETKILAEWRRIFNIPETSFRFLVKKGMDYPDILSKYERGEFFGCKANYNKKGQKVYDN